MSNGRYPTLGQVFPFFRVLCFKLDSFLSCTVDEIPNYATVDRMGTLITLAKAVQMARLKLEKYFACANRPESYHSLATGVKLSVPNNAIESFIFCFIVLDPRFKTEYFKAAGWPSESVDSVREMAEYLWETLYKSPEQFNVPEIPPLPSDSIRFDASNQTIVQLLWSNCSNQVRSLWKCMQKLSRAS